MYPIRQGKDDDRFRCSTMDVEDGYLTTNTLLDRLNVKHNFSFVLGIKHIRKILASWYD